VNILYQHGARDESAVVARFNLFNSETKRKQMKRNANRTRRAETCEKEKHIERPKEDIAFLAKLVLNPRHYIFTLSLTKVKYLGR
jgi:hypothetical protein